MSDEAFRQCSICRKPIAFQQNYFECSVSTCNRKKTGLFFCSVECWDAHLPMMRHRDAWGVKVTAPTRADWERQQAEEEGTMNSESDERELGSHAAEGSTGGTERSSDGHDEVLIVVSKLKKYIRAQSGMNTSDAVIGVLSEHLRRLCNDAIRSASADGRKTVLDRDFAGQIAKPE
jgi:hypothetical protein